MADADPRGARPGAARPRDKRTFVVEVWLEGGAFRAVARDVAQEQARRFDTLDRLANYLGTQHQPGGEETPPPSR